jgi:hypothetical protein
MGFFLEYSRREMHGMKGMASQHRGPCTLWLRISVLFGFCSHIWQQNGQNSESRIVIATERSEVLTGLFMKIHVV